MKRVELKLENLVKLDAGKPEAMFTLLMKRVIADLIDRPSLDKARTVTMKFSFTPADTLDGDCDHINVEIDFDTKIPGFTSRPFAMKAHRNNMLSFHPDFPTDPDEDGMFDNQDPEDDKKGKQS